NKIISELEQELKTKQSAFESSLAFENEVRNKIHALEASIESAKDKINQESRQLDAKQNEYNLTKSMVDNLEGFPESIGFLRKHASWARQAPLFSDILFCKEEYRICIENYLEPLMNHYVVQSREEAISAIKLLSESSRGRANFFILDSFKEVEGENLANIPPNSIAALDVIDVDAAYSRLCSHLLRHVYILDELGETTLQQGSHDPSWILLSKSGKYTSTR